MNKEKEVVLCDLEREICRESRNDKVSILCWHQLNTQTEANYNIDYLTLYCHFRYFITI